MRGEWGCAVTRSVRLATARSCIWVFIVRYVSLLSKNSKTSWEFKGIERGREEENKNSTGFQA